MISPFVTISPTLRIMKSRSTYLTQPSDVGFGYSAAILTFVTNSKPQATTDKVLTAKKCWLIKKGMFASLFFRGCWKFGVTVLIGYCDYHPVTKSPKIGCCDMS